MYLVTVLVYHRELKRNSFFNLYSVMACSVLVKDGKVSLFTRTAAFTYLSENVSAGALNIIPPSLPGVGIQLDGYEIANIPLGS